MYAASLGFAGGIMIAASVFGFTIPGVEQGALWQVMAGVFLGGFGLLARTRLIAHVHTEYREWRGHGGADGEEPAIDDRVRRVVRSRRDHSVPYRTSDPIGASPTVVRRSASSPAASNIPSLSTPNRVVGSKFASTTTRVPARSSTS